MYSNLLTIVKCLLSFSPIRSVFVITFIVGKFKRNLIDVAKSAIETKFIGVVINAPSKRKMLVFSSDGIFSIRKRPLERYANNSILSWSINNQIVWIYSIYFILNIINF